MSTIDFNKRVSSIQAELRAPKGQWNDFGKFNYRSCEDILEAVKPLLGGLVLTLSDDIVAVSDRVYVKATATLTDGEQSISNTAFAREQITKKGMDDMQLTGTTSSYARKYALNGLFLIDDNKDADTGVQHKPAQQQAKAKADPNLIKAINMAADLPALASLWNTIPADQKTLLAKCKDQRKAALQGV